MHPQLQTIIDDFGAALDRLRQSAATFPEANWAWRPSPEGWSASECVEHLNLTSTAYLKIIPVALDEARRLGGSPPVRLRRDFIGWLIGQVSGPKPRMRAKTGVPFQPASAPPLAILLQQFESLQGRQIECVREADGLPIHRVRIVSPFAERVSYSLYSALAILPGHQHRHLGQAERALAAAPR
jgi:hypothetical protein